MTRGLACLGLAAVVACGSGHDDREPVVREASSSDGSTSPSGGWTIAAAPLLEIPSPEDSVELSRVAGAVALTDGRIVVADGLALSIHFFSADGTHLTTVGRPGRGPAEYERISLLARIGGDTLLVGDPMLRRIAVLDYSGRLERHVSLEGGEGPLQPLAALADGSVMVRELLRGSGAPGLNADPWRVLVYAPDGRRTRSLGAFAFGQIWKEFGDDGSGMVMTVSFTATSHVAAAGGTIAIGRGDEPGLRVWSEGEDPVTLTWNATPRPIGAEDWAAARERARDPRQPESMRRLIDAAWDKIPKAEWLPVFDQLTFDDSGNIWVRDYLAPTDSMSRWTVLSPSGEVVARVEGPARLRLLEVGNETLLAEWLDPDDVPRVRAYAFRGGE